jgi:hypothetical protein
VINAMSATQIVIKIPAIAFLIVLSGCWAAERKDVEASQCWNPRILRAKVGNAIFDIPKGIEFFNVDEGRPPDLLWLNLQSHSFDSNFRITCQSKSNVPLDFGDHVGYQLESKKDGRTSKLIGEIRTYDPKSKDKRFYFYLVDMKDVLSIKLIGYTSRFNINPNSGRNLEVGRNLRFGFGGRSVEVPCQVWGELTKSEDEWVKGTTFAYSCAGGVPIRIGDIIITVTDPNALFNVQTGKVRIPPPEFWPLQWHDTVAKITSYRIDKSGLR